MEKDFAKTLIACSMLARGQFIDKRGYVKYSTESIPNVGGVGRLIDNFDEITRNGTENTEKKTVVSKRTKKNSQ